MAFTGVEHGLNGEDHAGLKLHALSRITVVQDLRLIMVDLADAMAAVLADHAEAFFFGQRLDRMANVTQGRARAHHTNSGAHGVVGGFHQVTCLRIGFADEVHAAGIAIPAILDHGDVDIDDIAVLEWHGIGDAMADNFIDRGTDSFRKAVIADVAGDGLLHIDDVVVADLV